MRESFLFQAKRSELDKNGFKIRVCFTTQAASCQMDISVPALCWHMIAYGYIQQYIDNTVFCLGIWQQAHAFHRSTIRESYSLPPIYENRKKVLTLSKVLKAVD